MNETSDFPRIASFMPILTREARKLAYGNRFTADDLIQEGVLAAISAFESYDPNRGNMYGFVRTCARNRMISYLRRNGHESPMEDDILDERLISAGTERSSWEHLEMMERRDALYSLLDRLSRFEADVLDAYLRGGGISGASEILECDRKKVDNALQRIRQKARGMNSYDEGLQP
jgi:RNA polymerase sigma factor (sigma-70 family)